MTIPPWLFLLLKLRRTASDSRKIGIHEYIQNMFLEKIRWNIFFIEFSDLINVVDYKFEPLWGHY